MIPVLTLFHARAKEFALPVERHETCVPAAVTIRQQEPDLVQLDRLRPGDFGGEQMIAPSCGVEISLGIGITGQQHVKRATDHKTSLRLSRSRSRHGNAIACGQVLPIAQGFESLDVQIAVAQIAHAVAVVIDPDRLDLEWHGNGNLLPALAAIGFARDFDSLHLAER